MRIAIHFSDGHHTAYDPKVGNFNGTEAEREEWLKHNTVEILDAEWRAYNAFMDQYIAWQQRLMSLDNEIYDKQVKAGLR